MDPTMFSNLINDSMIKDHLTHTEKLKLSARYWLLGAATFDKRYYKCLDALEIAIGHHDGVRNDGTDEIAHMIGVFQLLRTMHNHLLDPVSAYIEALLHDCIEDPNQLTKKFIAPSEIQAQFGSQIHDELLIMSKEILGQKNPQFLLSNVFLNVNTSVVKPGDRDNNVASMYGTFKPARLARYIKETKEEYFAGLKVARRKFPEQEPIYENIKLSLTHKLQLIEHLAKKDEESSAAGRGEVPEASGTNSRGPG
jgi:hypothetical protein